MQPNNYTASLYAVEVERRNKSLYNLLKDLGLPRGAIISVLQRVSKTALLDSTLSNIDGGQLIVVEQAANLCCHY
jgi:hypothetical protein